MTRRRMAETKHVQPKDMQTGPMKIFGLAGWSGSGKTTLLVRLLPELVGRGISVSTVKHAHHSFEIDRPGKDSYEHRVAGATEVMVTGGLRWALMHEIRDQPEPGIADLMRHMTPVDLLLIEGFKNHAHPKLEVHRPATGRPLLCTNDPNIVAVASDAEFEGLDIPLLDLNDARAVANFIEEYCGLQSRVRDGTA
jgi:molybdopterin-guanine dinucleotide biosynthesis protein B